MSIVAQGSERLAWVCRCKRGLRSTSSPAIHSLAGEKVCIQAMTPMHASSLLASMHARRICAALVRTGFQLMLTPISGPAFSSATTSLDCAATCRSVSSP